MGGRATEAISNVVVVAKATSFVLKKKLVSILRAVILEKTFATCSRYHTRCNLQIKLYISKFLLSFSFLFGTFFGPSSRIRDLSQVESS